MDRTERFYRIDQLLNEQRCLSFDALQDALGVSRATLRRDLQYLRDRLNAPIVYDRLGGVIVLPRIPPRQQPQPAAPNTSCRVSGLTPAKFTPCS